MIISFSLENWMSFRDQVTFSMVASRERQHGDRVPKVAKYQTRILPISAIYGGNASGKTNFFKALNFVKRYVVKGIDPDSNIPVETFQLDRNSFDKPSRFKLELLIDETIYEFSFAVTRKLVLEEKLVQINSNSEKTLYFRQGEKPNFHPSLNKNQFLHFAFQGTRDNQLFLTNSVSQKVDNFRPVYDWFKISLLLVAPDSRFGRIDYILDQDGPFHNTMNVLLSNLDTGISHLGEDEIPFDSIPFSEEIKNLMKEDIKEGETIHPTSSRTKEQFSITRKSGELLAKKMVSFHPRSDGTLVKFAINQESDGSQRVINLLPAFIGAYNTNAKMVIVVDEIDRSLHTHLTRQLIEAYLENCSTDSRTQMLLTTHDLLLMDQGLFRRDEMWVAERHQNGTSDLFSLSDYKDIRYDKDIRKSYLQGRLGGVPRILWNNSMTSFTEDA